MIDGELVATLTVTRCAETAPGVVFAIAIGDGTPAETLTASVVESAAEDSLVTYSKPADDQSQVVYGFAPGDGVSDRRVERDENAFAVSGSVSRTEADAAGQPIGTSSMHDAEIDLSCPEIVPYASTTEVTVPSSTEPTG